MKKLILVTFLAFGVLGFSKTRFVEECEVISRTSGSATCESLESGKKFQFTSGRLSSLSTGSVYKVFFEGEGYRRLRLNRAVYLYEAD